MEPWLHRSDWWSGDSELHPLAVGAAIVLVVFFWIRLTGNRTLAGITIFDWILSVALGSTLSRIITQPDLDFTRGLFSCLLILFFELASSWVCANVPNANRLLKARPALIVFRGDILHDAVRANRLHVSGVHQALRQRGVARVRDVEAMVLEGNGTLSIIMRSQSIETEFPMAMDTVPGYREKRERWEQDKLGSFREQV